MPRTPTTKRSPAQSPAKQRYIADVAYAAATRGQRFDTLAVDERRQVTALLRRAGIKLPRLTPLRLIAKKINMEKAVGERIANEERLFVESVAIARALYRLTGKGNSAYGRQLILDEPEHLPKWFKETLSRVDSEAARDIGDPKLLPGRRAAFSDHHAAVKAEIAEEIGIEGRPAASDEKEVV